MSIRERVKRLTKFRFAVLYPVGAAAVLVCNSDDPSFRRGLWIVIAGLLIRLWANGYAVKTEKLTSSGPYAFIRHPLYFGTMLIVIGFVFILKAHTPGAILVVLIGAIYYRTIQKEEKMLIERFGAAYEDYRRSVPLLWPRLVPYRKGEKWGFSMERLMRSQEYKLSFWIIIMLLFFYLKEELIAEHGEMTWKRWAAFAMGILLGVADFALTLLKNRSTPNSPPPSAASLEPKNTVRSKSNPRPAEFATV